MGFSTAAAAVTTAARVSEDDALSGSKAGPALQMPADVPAGPITSCRCVDPATSGTAPAPLTLALVHHPLTQGVTLVLLNLFEKRLTAAGLRLADRL